MFSPLNVSDTFINLIASIAAGGAIGAIFDAQMLRPII